MTSLNTNVTKNIAYYLSLNQLLNFFKFYSINFNLQFNYLVYTLDDDVIESINFFPNIIVKKIWIIYCQVGNKSLLKFNHIVQKMRLVDFMKHKNYTSHNDIILNFDRLRTIIKTYSNICSFEIEHSIFEDLTFLYNMKKITHCTILRSTKNIMLYQGYITCINKMPNLHTVRICFSRIDDWILNTIKIRRLHIECIVYTYAEMQMALQVLKSLTPSICDCVRSISIHYVARVSQNVYPITMLHCLHKYKKLKRVKFIGCKIVCQEGCKINLNLFPKNLQNQVPLR